MDTLTFIGAQTIAPSLLGWGLLRSSLLNGNARKSARLAESHAWIVCGLAIALSLHWGANGRTEAVFSSLDSHWFGLRLDVVSVPLLLLVSFLGAIILRFSKNYMSGDPNHGRFTKWMCITLGCVAALVTSPGLVQFFVAWVATSLSLHQLLVFYPERHGTLFSARKKFLISRIADLCLAIAFVEIYRSAGTQRFDALLAAFQTEQNTFSALVPWLIAVAAMLKSAQFPFHTWLPDTMGTPTPVSSLMHAGIINAGGFLVIRFAPLFQSHVGPLYLLAIVGAFTAAFGSLVMLTQTSVKRSLAYSTIAQMGFMLMQCGLGAFHLALLHIVAHSLYKAHSFLSSGSTILAIQARLMKTSAQPRSLWGTLLPLTLGFALAALPLWFGGTSLSEKPGALVFTAVLAAALGQFLAQSPSRHFTTNMAIATSIGSLYFLINYLSVWWIQPAITIAPLVHPIFEWSLAIAIIGIFVSFIQIQTITTMSAPPSWTQRLYVHALNGFYLNTMANRAIRFLRLHPDEA